MRHFISFLGHSKTLDEVMKPLARLSHRGGEEFLENLAYECKFGERYSEYLGKLLTILAKFDQKVKLFFTKISYFVFSSTTSWDSGEESLEPRPSSRRLR